MIHSLDQGQLKSDETQEHLSELATIPQISMVISVDHIGAARMWNDQ